MGTGKWRVLLKIALMGGLTSLMGCGKDGSSPNPPPFNDPNARMTIETFGVTGTSVANSVVQIEPKSSVPPPTGILTVNWTVKGNDTYTARVYVSSDAVRDSGDIEIHAGCGKVTTTDICRSTTTLACTFETTGSTNTISCSTPSGNQVAKDVTSVVPIANPRTSVPAFIIMQACNPNGTCFPAASSARVVPVRFH